jgi:hypothetical protein
MATTLQAARERVANVKAKWDAIKAEKAAATKARDTINARSVRRRKPLAKRIALVLRPGEQHEFTSMDLRPSYVNYVSSATETAEWSPRKRAARLLELATAGQIKINPPGGGNGIGAQGLAGKLRLVDAAAVKRIKAADAKAAKAEAAARKARQEWRDLKALEWANGAKVTRDEIAAIVAAAADDLVLLNALPNPYFDERTMAMEIADADAHLQHVKSKSKEPCPCDADTRARNEATWAARREADAKARAEREAAAVKALEKAPKVRFTCPACGCDQVAAVSGEGVVECDDEMCGVTLSLNAIRSTRVAKSTAVGIIADDAEDPDEADEAA